MLIVIATAVVEERNRQRMEEVGRAMLEASRGEAGCLGYASAWDFLQPNVMNAIELWRDEAALRFHFGTPHMAAFLKALAEMGNSAPEISVHPAESGHEIRRYFPGQAGKKA